MAVLRSATDAWTTTARFSCEKACCTFGCAGESDDLMHYVRCLRLRSIVDSATPDPPTPPGHDFWLWPQTKHQFGQAGVASRLYQIARRGADAYVVAQLLASRGIAMLTELLRREALSVAHDFGFFITPMTH